MAKYNPLRTYFENASSSQKDILLSFSQIENILGEKLPESANIHSAWWSNERDGRHVQAHSWMDAGWLVSEIDQARKWVKFKRSR